MALSFTKFVNGDTVSSSEIKAQLDSVEDLVNEDISSANLTSSTGWIKRELLYKPEFYGSPSPRAEMITGDTYYRQSPFGIPDQAHFHPDINLSPQAVHGLSATFKVPRDNCRVSVYCNFWAYESGGNLSGTVTSIQPTTGASPADAIDLYLYLGSSKRDYHIDAYTDSSGAAQVRVPTSANFLARKNISMICHKVLDQGVHSVGVYCLPLVSQDIASSGFGGRVAVDVRSMVVDVHSNYQSS